MNKGDRRIFNRFKSENFVTRSTNRPKMEGSDRFSAMQRVVRTLRGDPNEQRKTKGRVAVRCMPS